MGCPKEIKFRIPYVEAGGRLNSVQACSEIGSVGSHVVRGAWWRGLASLKEPHQKQGEDEIVGTLRRAETKE